MEARERQHKSRHEELEAAARSTLDDLKKAEAAAAATEKRAAGAESAANELRTEIQSALKKVQESEDRIQVIFFLRLFVVSFCAMIFRNH